MVVDIQISCQRIGARILTRMLRIIEVLTQVCWEVTKTGVLFELESKYRLLWLYSQICLEYSVKLLYHGRLRRNDFVDLRYDGAKERGRAAKEEDTVNLWEVVQNSCAFVCLCSPIEKTAKRAHPLSRIFSWNVAWWKSSCKSSDLLQQLKIFEYAQWLLISAVFKCFFKWREHTVAHCCEGSKNIVKAHHLHETIQTTKHDE